MTTSEPVPFPIVGIGASAGGLEALTQLFQRLPATTGMAFVVIQHLDPGHPSLLAEALGKATAMKVEQAEDDVAVEPDRVYVIPPGAELSIYLGKLVVAARRNPAAEGRGLLHLPVDAFLRSLAAERGGQAIGVVLSGTASDGTEGLRAIKAADGITFAQDPPSARFPGMPRSAIDAGVVDEVLAPTQLADELARLGRHPYVSAPAQRLPETDAAAFQKILAAVRDAHGVDFAAYKAPTVERRLARRMAVRRVDDPEAYLALVEAEPEELRALHDDILIHVTSFFRDPEVFETLKAKVFPEILRDKAEGVPVRMWVAGCSTGQEVYSLAIALREHLGESKQPIQIFGSDIGERAIEKARAGVYPESALRDVSQERRRRWFTSVDNGHRIVKAIRDLCVFVERDLSRDPPFAKLDLVSCRNVLIYFDSELQARVLSRLHYSLNRPGFLLLGRTENVGSFGNFFSTIDRGHKIFRRSATASALTFDRGWPERQIASPAAGPKVDELPRSPRDVTGHVDRLLMSRYVPPGVLINVDLEILQFRGQTGPYLQQPPGAPQSHVLKMARGELVAALRTTIARAKAEAAPVRSAPITIERDGAIRTCDVVVLPFPDWPEAVGQLYLVLFEDGPATKVDPPLSVAGLPGKDDPRIVKLQHELAATTDYLHSLLEDQTQTNDDLGAANHELISGNEELQSLNEELEAAKEELQSTNEELTTVNEELHSRNQEMGRVNSDLVNVLGTVEIPILILDRERRIRRFTPSARRIVNIVPGDVGRPLEDLSINIIAPDLDANIAEVVETTVAKEAEVQDRAGHWYRMRILPYWAPDEKIDGAILSFIDIDALKHLVSDAERAGNEAERANRAKDQFLATLSHELRSPLASMLVHAQLLGRGRIDEKSVRRAGEAIERGTKMQVQLIEDLIDVSRIVAGKLELELRSTDLGAIVDEAIEAARGPAERKLVALEAFVDRAIGPLSGDTTRLLQVVSNLLTNAIKFTPAGGKVTLHLEADGARARLMVRDTGVGIEPAFLPHVFNRFTQEDSSSTRTYGGLGLGLAIVRQLVELHGGTVEAKSDGKGRGAELSVVLPLLATIPGTETRTLPARPAAPDFSPPGFDDGRLRQVRILVVDDDPATREAVAEMLRQRGAQVTVAASPDEAMVSVEETRPEVLVCDIAMPGEDGYGFVRRLRTLGPGQGGDIPALALTALAGAEDRQQALAAGFQVHLVKPVDIERLVAAVASLRVMPARPAGRLDEGYTQ